MGTTSMTWALRLLQITPRDTAEHPEFVSLWDELVDGFDECEHETLREAYDLAVSDDADAAMDLAELIERVT